MKKIIVALGLLGVVGCGQQAAQLNQEQQQQQQQGGGGSNFWLWYWLGSMGRSNTTIHTPSSSGVVHSPSHSRVRSSSNISHTTAPKTPKPSFNVPRAPKVSPPTFSKPRPASSFSRPSYRSSSYRSRR